MAKFLGMSSGSSGAGAKRRRSGKKKFHKAVLHKPSVEWKSRTRDQA